MENMHCMCYIKVSILKIKLLHWFKNRSSWNIQREAVLQINIHITYAMHTLNLYQSDVQQEYFFDCLWDSDEQWICKIHFFDDEYFLIICCTYAQAKTFVQIQCAEMNLSFKMIQESTNLFSVCDWNEDVKCKWNICFVYA